MSATTQPVFIVGTGRCGTRALYKMLLGTPGVEVHHEYLCTHVQQIAALWAMLQLGCDDVEKRLDALYGAAVKLTAADVWMDSSNKAAWLIDPIGWVCPGAKFVAVYRDGRKVASSFLHKLGDECYDDSSTRALFDWYHRRGRMPPPEKKYWWQLPTPDDEFFAAFPSFNQFQRICYHWQTCNAEIKRQLGELPADSYLEVKLEDLVSDPAKVDRLARFIGVEPDPRYFTALQKPQGVIVPQDFELTAEQEEQFWAICRPMMEVLGYADRPSYRVNY